VSLYAELAQRIERRTGKSIDELRSMTISELRCEAEKKHGPMHVTKEWPLIGRGSVMGDYVVSRDEIERQLDDALHDDG
jgi:hypothetical protein